MNVKHIQLTISITFVVCILVCTFFPWAVINSQKISITGWDTDLLRLGKPAILLVGLAICSSSFLSFGNCAWKNLALLFCALQVAWQIRNLLLLSVCQFGECPKMQPAFYASCALVILYLPYAILYLRKNQR